MWNDGFPFISLITGLILTELQRATELLCVCPYSHLCECARDGAPPKYVGVHTSAFACVETSPFVFVVVCVPVCLWTCAGMLKSVCVCVSAHCPGKRVVQADCSGKQMLLLMKEGERETQEIKLICKWRKFSFELKVESATALTSLWVNNDFSSFPPFFLPPS